MERMFGKLLDTELVQRSHDGRWELIGKFMDEENSYKYENEQGIKVTLVPEKWITLKVYDWLMEEV